ncbi:hypothetical protein GGS26DRAFT_556018 [Hypomontagnella submonticulosa]|nr:hypothetical protein GGS26DRAFT_556018 [Hypomontagnella submonticulosa]
MQFSTITTLFALAAVAVAAPTEVTARTDGKCTNEQPNQVCCANGIFDCVLTFGSTCGGTAYCCKGTGDGGFINIAVLNCVELL